MAKNVSQPARDEFCIINIRTWIYVLYMPHTTAWDDNSVTSPQLTRLSVCMLHVCSCCCVDRIFDLLLKELILHFRKGAPPPLQSLTIILREPHHPGHSVQVEEHRLQPETPPATLQNFTTFPSTCCSSTSVEQQVQVL